MPDISKIQLPGSNIAYDLKDAVARQAIAGGVSFVIAWNGSSTPVVADIPAGVVVRYSGTDYTGTLSADSAQVGAFYLVAHSNSTSLNKYDEYVPVGTSGSKSWESLGPIEIDLSDLGALAYKDSVTLNKGTGDNVLGEATTFTNSSSIIDFTGQKTGDVLGEGTTFTTTVTPTTTNIKATASGTAVGANGTDTFVKSYPGSTSKLATTTVPNVTGNTDVTIPNVTSAGSASTWSFSMGTGADAETLIISGANGSAPTLGTALSASKVTLGTAKTVATGSLSASGEGGTVMTGLGTAVTADALTGVQVTSQPTVSLSTGATAGTGVISVATGITSATTEAGGTTTKVITKVGDATARAQTITVGNNDTVKVAKYDDLSVSVS